MIRTLARRSLPRVLVLLLFFIVLPVSALWAEEKKPVFSFKSLVKNASSSVVSIRSEEVAQNGNSPLKDYFKGGRYLNSQVKEGSLGTGFIVHEKGLVLTNYHVLRPPPTYHEVSELRVILSDQRVLKARLIGKDKKLNVALLKIESPGHFSPVTLGDSEAIEVGEWVVALGNPFGLETAISVGVVSGLGRFLGTGPYDQFIQTDALIHAGNTGGPLYDIHGEVIGINTTVASSGQGIGFATPINLIKNILPMLETEGKVTRGWLGVMIQGLTPDLAKAFKLKEARGALISEVLTESPAARGGLKRGDVIIRFNGRDLDRMQDLPRFVAETAVGKTVELELIREGKALVRKVQIEKMKEE